jgi:small conductance mechanosensitive channel
MTDLGDIGIEDIQENVEELHQNASALKEYIKSQIPALTGFCIKVVLAILAFWIGRKIIRWIVKVMKRSLEKGNADQGVIQFTGSLVNVILYILLLVNIFVSLGVQASSVAALLGTAGVTVGLALQGGLANIAGGVILLVFKPFQVGDYIVCNSESGTEGTVTKIDICYTTLLSIDNKNILVPNGTLSNTTITNVTARDQRRLEIKVGISYDSDLRKAKEILEDLLLKDEDTQSDAEMVVFVDELGEHSVVLGFRVWVPTERYWATKWRMNQKIKETFDEEGIRIPYPQMDVHIK